MTDELNVVNDTQQGVVDPASEDVSAVEAQVEPEETIEQESAQAEVAPAEQPLEENQAFAKMRRELEASQREKAEAAEKLAAYEQNEVRLQEVLQEQYGFKGNLEQIADELAAAQSGRTVAEVRAERQQAEEAKRKEAERVAKMQNMEAELNYYRNMAVDKLKTDLLKEIKEAYPDCAAKSVDEFGDDFANLLEHGVSPAMAYAAYKSVQEAKSKPTPPEMGAVNNRETPESEYYTLEELKGMSQAEVHKHWKKVEKSREKIFGKQ